MKSRLILVSFLLVLYIGPSLFAMSYASSTIPTEPNMTKDFSISEEWYNDSWLYRKRVLMGAGVDGAETDYQVKVEVQYDSGMQADFDDILFTDNDNVTLLDYWRESYIASTSAIFWVKISDSQEWGTYVTFQMYFGNDEASTTSDGEATFLFFDDFEDNNLDNWADTSNMEIATDRKRGSYSASWINSGSNGFLQDNTFDGLSGIRVSFWNNIDITERGSFIYVYSEADYSESVATIRVTYEDDTSEMYYRDSGTYVSYPDSADDMDDDTWHKIEFAVDFDSDTMQTWQNGVANGKLSIVDDDGDELDTEEVDGIGLMMQSDKQVWFDDVIVRKWIEDEPEVASFGDKEYRFPPAWHEAGEAEVIFSVAIDETGLDLLLIFLGLCMIPASMLYMAKGGTSEMSTNKFFYGLIIFFLGWGLFIGGIL